MLPGADALGGERDGLDVRSQESLQIDGERLGAGLIRP
jgi:hypothetical protein